MLNRDHLERLLREPNNLFGPATGRGYDYGRAALILAALAAAGVSTACLLFALNREEFPPAARVGLLIVAIPNLIAYPFLWPMNLLLGLATSFVVWLATFSALAYLRGWRNMSPRAGRVSVIVALAGWLFGAGVYAWLWLS